MSEPTRSAESQKERLVVGIGISEEPDEKLAVRRALNLAYAVLPHDPGLVLLFSTVNYDLATLLGAARIFTGPVPLIGGTSGYGILNNAGIARGGNKGAAVAAVALAGANISAGVGTANVGGNGRAAGEAAAAAALAAANIEGKPKAAMVFCPPGNEESILRGISTTLPRGVPIFGCTVADEDLSGHWAIFAGNKLSNNNVAVALLYGDFMAGTAFSGGYWPTSYVAHASGVSGRMVSKIGEQTALQTYSEWLGVPVEILKRQSIRHYTMDSPLAVEDIHSHRLLIKEPGTVSGDGHIGFLADINEGDHLRLLTSTPESLISATGAAVAEAMTRASLTPDRVCGLIVGHGLGRVQALQTRANEVPLQIRKVAGNAPMIGCCTYGEQSMLPSGKPVHLNLTAAVLVLGC